MAESVKVHNSSLLKRVFAALVFGPVIIWVFWTKGIVLYVFLVGITAFGQWELYLMMREKLRFPHRLIGFVSGLLILTDVYLGHSEHLIGIIVLSLMLYFTYEIFFGKDDRLRNVSLALFVTVYPALFTAFLIKIDLINDTYWGSYKRFILLFVLVTVWIFDTSSYFIGRFFGKHRFFPGISPGKTAEGFWGGFISVLLMGLIISLINIDSLKFHFLAIAVITALAGQIGDLSESIIKREMGIKDSSRIIPGHGGILDRFDSLIFAGPVVYFYMVLCSLYYGGRF